VVEEDEMLTEDLFLKAERPSINLEGMRADQVLTGPLFQLNTTRDPDTEEALAEYTRLAALDAKQASAGRFELG